MNHFKPRVLSRWNRLIAPAWLGCLLALASIATPAPFATLAKADAGRVVSRMLAQEAYLSLALGVIVLVLARMEAARATGERGLPASGTGESLFGTAMLLALGTLFCTIVGYFVLQPMMTDARGGQGSLSFGQLHAISGSLFAVKVVLVAVLAWRTTRG